jgi:hypothetical protein
MVGCEKERIAVLRITCVHYTEHVMVQLLFSVSLPFSSEKLHSLIVKSGTPEI